MISKVSESKCPFDKYGVHYFNKGLRQNLAEVKPHKLKLN